MFGPVVGLLEYRESPEDGGGIHLNVVTDGRLNYMPFTNGYQPVCVMNETMREDDDFSVFCMAHTHIGLTSAMFREMVVAFLEGRYPEMRDFWKVDVEGLRSDVRSYLRMYGLEPESVIQ